MSTLHGNIHWPALRKDLIPEACALGPYPAATTFRWEDSDIAAITSVVEYLFEQVIGQIAITAQLSLEKKRRSDETMCAWTKNAVKETIFKSAAAYAKIVARNAPLEENKETAPQLKTLKKAHELVEEFIETHTPLHDQPHLCFVIPPRKFDEWHAATVAALFHHAYTSLGMQSDAQPISFSAGDLQTFEIEATAAKAERLSCFAFALLKIGEMRAKALIFDSPAAQQRLIHDAPILLKKWGYRVITYPDAGDLVLYLSKNEPVHAGIFLESGRILSKMGALNPFVYEHDLGQVPKDYGNRIVFFRKTVS